MVYVPEQYAYAVNYRRNLVAGEKLTAYNEEESDRELRATVYAIQPKECYNHCLTSLSGATGFFFNIYNEGSDTVCSCARNPTTPRVVAEAAVFASCVAAGLQIQTYVQKGVKKVTTVKHGETLKVLLDVTNPAYNKKAKRHPKANTLADTINLQLDFSDGLTYKKMDSHPPMKPKKGGNSKSHMSHDDYALDWRYAPLPTKKTQKYSATFKLS